MAEKNKNTRDITPHDFAREVKKMPFEDLVFYNSLMQVVAAYTAKKNTDSGKRV